MIQNEKYRLFNFSSFAGGINKGIPATEINDDECQELLNIHFDRGNNLVTRSGVKQYSAGSFTNRVSSLYGAYFSDSSVAPIIIITVNNDILRENTVGNFTSIKGSLVLPNDTPYHWITFGDLIIGANGQLTGSGYNNPICWDSTGNARQLKDGSNNAPSAKYMAVFGNRLWMVSADYPNTIYWSKLGNPEDFTVTGGTIGGGSADINANDGDVITGIYSHKESLFIFKRRKIYRLITGTPNTDPTQWSVVEFASNIGCISQWTIQGLIDDLIFLSDYGVYSLNAAMTTGDFRTASLSNNIPDLNSIIQQCSTYNPFASCIYATDSEYWLSTPDPNSLENTVVWVMDFKQITQGKVRWSKFDSLVAGGGYLINKVNGSDRLVIAGSSSNPYLYEYGDKTLISDAGASFTKRHTTKAYNLQDNATRKDFNHYGYYIQNNVDQSINPTIAFTSYYRLDRDDSKKGSFSISYTQTESGAVYDSSNWDDYNYASATPNYFSFNRKITDPNTGKRAVNLELILECTNNSSFIILGFNFEASPLTGRRVGKV